jgi:6-carboxyhexanoate--CoA ligase
MRASKTVSGKQSAVSSQKEKEIHISGAEGIYEDSEIHKAVKEYTQRALTHPLGKPDKIVITVEEIKQKPKRVPFLSVATLRCNSPDDAINIITQKLSDIGISKKAIINAFNILTSKKTMRGASLICMKSGKRVEPDKERGVRVSRLGIEKSAKKRLSQRLSKIGINTATVKEALILASKVASCPDVVAEVCISDDPDYTTGYIATREFGYLRIPNIKKYKEKHGGRVFFVKKDADIDRLIGYLEKIPVILFQE